jgi:hypothetical protein
MQKLGKAGASRWRGIRPTVRGVAMNPVDHPLGGGAAPTSPPPPPPPCGLHLSRPVYDAFGYLGTTFRELAWKT